jgi:hypothetical protein
MISGDYTQLHEMGKNSNILNWFKGLSEGWKTITILSGFVVTVAMTAIGIDHFKNKIADESAVINYLKKDSIARDKREHIKDSVETKRHEEINSQLSHISDSLKKDFVARDIFQDNYSRFVWDKFGNEWMRYMNGMQVTIIQNSSEPSKSFDQVKPSFKIHIEQDTTKKR